MDTTLPSALQALFLSFGPVFTAPSFENFVRLVTGWVLCRGRHTVSAVIRAGGAGGKHFSALYRFFSRAQWEPDELGRALFEVLAALLSGTIQIIVDDTLLRRSGPHFWGAGMHHDPLKSSYGGGGGRHLALAFGHNRVTLALWIALPWGRERGIAVPFLWRTYRSKKRAPAGAYRTRPQLAAELLEVFIGWDLGERKITLAGDGEYACQTVVRRLPPNVEFIGPMLMKAALYERPRRQRRRGRRRLKGARLPSPEKLAASSRRWKTCFPVIYGRKVAVKVKSQVGLWYTVAGTRMVRVVVTRDPKGRIGDRAYFSTDLGLSVEELLAGYAKRWSLEVAFRDAKQHLGLEDPQNGWWRRHRPRRRGRKQPGPQPRGNRGRRAVEHTVPLAFCVYGLVVAWYLRHGKPERDVQRARKLSPWYRHKTEPSFADMLGALGREICHARISAHPSLNPVRRIVQRLLLPAWSLPA